MYIFAANVSQEQGAFPVTYPRLLMYLIAAPSLHQHLLRDPTCLWLGAPHVKTRLPWMTLHLSRHSFLLFAMNVWTTTVPDVEVCQRSLHGGAESVRIGKCHNLALVQIGMGQTWKVS